MNQGTPPHDSLVRLLAYAEKDPDNWNLRADLFDRALALGELDLARAQAEHALRSLPGDAPWRHRLALTLLAEHRFEEAQAELEALVSSGADNAVVRHNLAYAIFSLGRSEDAAAVLGPLVAGEQDPTGGVLTLWLRCQHRLGRLEEALGVFRREAAQHPVAPEACGVASLIALDADLMEEARALCELALRGRPDQLEAQVARGTLALGDQQVQLAVGAFEQALRLNPRDGRSWSGLAFARLLGGDLGAAQQAFRSAVASMDGHVATWIAFGWSLVLAGKATEAREVFEKALERDRNFPECHGALAVSLARLGERDRAEHEIEVALRLDPDTMSARFAQAVLDGEADDPATILRLVQQIKRQRPDPGIATAEGILTAAVRRKGERAAPGRGPVT